MITTPGGAKITRFKDLWGILPDDLRQRIWGLKNVPQRPDYHPEGNTLKHIIVVVDRAIKSGDPDIVCTALFHDIGKDVTFAISPAGHPTAIDHEDESAKLVKDHRGFIKTLGGNPVIVYYLVKQHMRVKTIDQMRTSKQKFLKSNPNFDKLKTFSSIDRGGLKLESKADAKMVIPDEIRKMAAAFKAGGHSLYVVGGAVRDHLLGHDPKDYDLATDAVPDQSLQIIKSMGYKSLEVGKSFGVVIAKMPSGDEYEIATFREDIGSGRRPDAVQFTDIGTDVKRRDLTINALFYDIDADKVVDLVGGTSDLKSGTIRTVGDPDARFNEDPLRKLRALRFYAKVGKTIDSKTLHALRNNDLSGVSAERIRDEFIKSIKGAQSPKKYLTLAHTLGYLNIIVGGMRYSADFSNNPNPEVQLALLLAYEPIQSVKNKLLELRYSSEEVRNIIFMIEMNDIALNGKFDRIYALYRQFPNIDKDVIKSFAKEVGLSRFVFALSKIDPSKINMADLTDRYKKEALGNAIKKEITDQFWSFYN